MIDVIKNIGHFSFRLPKEWEGLDGKNRAVMLDDVVSILEEYQRKQPQADKWIPYTVGGELPHNVQKVWLSFTNEVCSNVKQAWWIYDHFEWDNGKRVKDYPIAWKPFIAPQPYKKEGAE